MIVVSGRAIRMTSDAFCTSVWKRDLAPVGVERLAQLHPVQRQTDLCGECFDGVGEVDGQLARAPDRR